MRALVDAKSEGLREALAKDARKLRTGQRCPVDLEVAAARLGVGLEWGSRRVLPAEGGLLRGPSGWTVAVSDGNRQRPRTRFTLAHEIGHYVLESHGVPRPRNRAEYWHVESLCHHFAGHLLVPGAAVEWVAAAAGRGAMEVLRRSAVVSRRALVSPQALSHRLHEDLEFCAFCEVDLVSPRPNVVGVVNWILERFAWLGIRSRNHITEDHFLARPLNAFRRLPRNQVRTGFLNGLPVAAIRRSQSVWMLGLEPALAQADSAFSPQVTLPLAQAL